MTNATRIHFENNLDVPLWLKIVATETDLEFHVYDHGVVGAVMIPAHKIASHPVTPEIERFKVPKIGKDGAPVLDENGEPQAGMDYWIVPHLPKIGRFASNDTQNPAGKVNLPDGPVISFYPVKEG